jgi:hypothetical protein
MSRLRVTSIRGFCTERDCYRGNSIAKANTGSCSFANGNALSGQQAPHVHVSPAVDSLVGVPLACI